MSKFSHELATRLLNQCGVTISGSEPFSIHVKDERLWDRVIAQRQLGFGEAYMDGWWDCEQMDEMLTRVIAADVHKNCSINEFQGRLKKIEKN